MTEATEPVAVEGGVLALEDYGTLAFESKLRVVDSLLETCTPDQMYVMLASVHSRFPAGRPQLATADALTSAEAWHALVPVLQSMALAHALRQVLLQLGSLPQDSTVLADQVFEDVAAMVQVAARTIEPAGVKEALGILNLLIRVAQYHKAFSAKTVATLVSKVAWFVDLRKKSTRYVTAIEDLEVQTDTRKASTKSKKVYGFKFTVVWSDGATETCLRSHNDLFDFQCKLLDLFPDQAKIDAKTGTRQIPYLPGKKLLVSGFKNAKGVAESRLPGVLDYLAKLVRLPVEISRCSHVTEFFELEGSEHRQSPTPTHPGAEIPMHDMASSSQPRGQDGAAMRTASYLEVGAGNTGSKDDTSMASLPQDLQQYQAQLPVQYMMYSPDGSVIPMMVPYAIAPMPHQPPMAPQTASGWVPVQAPMATNVYENGVPYAMPGQPYYDPMAASRYMQQLQYDYVMGDRLDPQFGAPNYGHAAPVATAGARGGERKKKDKNGRAKSTERRTSGGGMQRKVSNPESGADGKAKGRQRGESITSEGVPATVPEGAKARSAMHGQGGASFGSSQSLHDSKPGQRSGFKSSTGAGGWLYGSTHSLDTVGVMKETEKPGTIRGRTESTQSLQSITSLDSIGGTAGEGPTDGPVPTAKAKKIPTCMLCKRENVDTWSCDGCTMTATRADMVSLLAEFNCAAENDTEDEPLPLLQLQTYVKRVMLLKSVRMHKYSQALMTVSRDWLENASEDNLTELGLTSGARKKLRSKLADTIKSWPQ